MCSWEVKSGTRGRAEGCGFEAQKPVEGQESSHDPFHGINRRWSALVQQSRVSRQKTRVLHQNGSCSGAEQLGPFS